MPPLPLWNRDIFLGVAANVVNNPWPVPNTRRTDGNWLFPEFFPTISALPSRYVFGAKHVQPDGDYQYWDIPMQRLPTGAFVGQAGIWPDGRTWTLSVFRTENPVWDPNQSGIVWQFDYARVGFADQYIERWLFPYVDEFGNPLNRLRYDWRRVGGGPTPGISITAERTGPDTDWPQGGRLSRDGEWFSCSELFALPFTQQVPDPPNSVASPPGTKGTNRGRDVA